MSEIRVGNWGKLSTGLPSTVLDWGQTTYFLMQMLLDIQGALY